MFLITGVGLGMSLLENDPPPVPMNGALLNNINNGTVNWSPIQNSNFVSLYMHNAFYFFIKSI
jgi:hypothetical protein